MSEEIEFSKKGKRKVSPFVGQELLYDFLTGQLDPERVNAVEEYLQSNANSKVEADKIRNGIKYAEKLRATQISNDLKEKVSEPSNYLQVVIEKIRFDEWPPALRMGLEASIVALGISVLAILIPWHKLMDLRIGSKEVILAELDKGFVGKTMSEADTTSKEEIMFPDEETPVQTAAAVDTSKQVQTVTTTTTSSTTTTLIVKGQPLPARPPKPLSVAVATPGPTPSEIPASVEKAVPAGAASSTEKRQGELYRGTIEVTNVQAISPKLVEKIQELGARKAGQVELGWNKTGKSSYFHFTMPAGRYGELLTVFQQYGQLKIQKEKHERVMPEGILRLIITVDEKQ